MLRTTVEGVTTLTMNNPAKLNGWTDSMLKALLGALEAAGEDDATQVLILTGAGSYYCAGVNLSGALQIDHPKKLRAMIIERNQALFEMFLSFPKAILIAANGPAIGACVTSATLCNAVILYFSIGTQQTLRSSHQSQAASRLSIADHAGS